MRGLLWVFAAVIISVNALALGITPANKQIDFAPNTETSIAYRIYNTEQREFTAVLNVTGELKQYITLDQSQITFTKDDKVKSFTLTLRFPGSLPKDAGATISVSGIPKDASATLSLSANLGIIGATGAVISAPVEQTPTQETKTADSTEQPVETGKSPYITIAVWLLLLIVAGNVAYFTYVRRVPKETLKDTPVQELKLPAHIQPAQNYTQPIEPVYTAQTVQEDDIPIPKPQPRGLYFSDGSPVQSVSELLYFVENIPDQVFHGYVNGQENMVAMWTDMALKEPRLALKIYDSTSRQDVISALNMHLISVQQKEEEAHHREELRAEIEKLKGELDYF